MCKENGLHKSYVNMLNRESVMKESLKKCNHNLFLKVMSYNKEKEKASLRDLDYFYAEANNRLIIENAIQKQQTFGKPKHRLSPKMLSLIGSGCHSYKKTDHTTADQRLLGKLTIAAR